MSADQKLPKMSVVGGHRRPKSPKLPRHSMPPATTPEARTALAEAIAARLPGTWRVEPLPDDEIRFEAELFGDRREWDYRVAARVLRGEGCGLLLCWAGRRTDKWELAFGADEDIYVCGLLTDDSTPEGLGRELQYADQYNVDIDHRVCRRQLERTDSYARPSDNGWNEVSIAADIAEEFLPKFLKQLPALRKALAEQRRWEAKNTEEIQARREARESYAETVKHGNQQLRALGFDDGNNAYADRFYAEAADPEADVPHLTLSGCGRKRHVNVTLTVRVTQLPAILKQLGYRMPTAAQRKQAEAKAAAAKAPATEAVHEA